MCRKHKAFVLDFKHRVQFFYDLAQFGMAIQRNDDSRVDPGDKLSLNIDDEGVIGVRHSIDIKSH